MARPRKHDGIVFRRKGTQFWWIRYRDRTGTRRDEPAGTADWKEAQKKLRDRSRTTIALMTATVATTMNIRTSMVD